MTVRLMAPSGTRSSRTGVLGLPASSRKAFVAMQEVLASWSHNALMLGTCARTHQRWLLAVRRPMHH